MTNMNIELNNGLQETNFFVYKGKRYPFNIVFFNCFSKYFTTCQIYVPPNAEIKLIDEGENNTNYSEASIIDFINYCQNQRINLNKENVIALHRLAKRYMVPSLIASTETFLLSHQKDFAIEFLKMKKSPEETSEYEELISKNMIDYIEDDELLNLPLSVIHRILAKYALKNDTTENKKVTDFCFSCLDRFGRPASVLFEFADFGSASGTQIKRLLTEYSDRFDFHFINAGYLKTLYELESSILEGEEKCHQEMSSMRLELERVRNLNEEAARNRESEIERIQSEMRNEFAQKIEKQQEEIKRRDSLIQKIQDDFTSQLNFLRDQIKELNEKVAQKSAVIEQLNRQIEEKKIKKLSCPFLDESYPQGIISYLYGTVNLSAGGKNNPDYPVSNVKDYDTKYFYNNCNCSPNSESDSFIKFDLGPSKKIDLHSYFIQSNDGDPSNQHPKTWRVEGSNDDSSWILLDRQVNDKNLRGLYITIFCVKKTAKKTNKADTDTSVTFKKIRGGMATPTMFTSHILNYMVTSLTTNKTAKNRNISRIAILYF